MLARDRIVLLQRHLLGLGARVLLGDIEVAGVSGADQLDLDGGRLGHNSHPRVRSATDWRRSIGIRAVMSTIRGFPSGSWVRSEEHTSELQSLMRISYAVFCLKK